MSDAVEAQPKKRAPKSDATRLTSLIVACKAELFHSPLREPFVTVEHSTMSLDSPEFKYWLAREFMRLQKRIPSQKAVAEAIAGIKGSALFNGSEHEVFSRVAAVGDRVFVDLGRQIAVISAAGWELQPHVQDVRFLRPKGFLALPEPIRSEQRLPALLRQVINVSNDDDLALIVAWLVGAARGRKPYPILDITGEQGSGKSSACRRLRRSIDPNVADSRVTPREMRDLMIAARNSHVIFYDNLTRLDEWLINGLCCLATGAGSATRELTTDTNEIIISAARPIVLNGINDVLSRPDLLDRALVVTLDPIPDDRRLTEAEADAQFEDLLPTILGSLFDAVACALRNESTTRPKHLPRMADFASTITAAAPALDWSPDYFLEIYSANRQGATEALLDSNMVASALRDFVADKSAWEGTASDLLRCLTTDDRSENKFWPRTAKALAGRLREVAPGLRAVGVDVGFERRMEGRMIAIRNSRASETGAISQGPVRQKQKSDDEIPF